LKQTNHGLIHEGGGGGVSGCDLPNVKQQDLTLDGNVWFFCCFLRFIACVFLYACGLKL
jgi:hypothetical protein